MMWFGGQRRCTVGVAGQLVVEVHWRSRRMRCPQSRPDAEGVLDRARAATSISAGSGCRPPARAGSWSHRRERTGARGAGAVRRSMRRPALKGGDGSRTRSVVTAAAWSRASNNVGAGRRVHGYRPVRSGVPGLEPVQRSGVPRGRRATARRPSSPTGSTRSAVGTLVASAKARLRCSEWHPPGGCVDRLGRVCCLRRYLRNGPRRAQSRRKPAVRLWRRWRGRHESATAV